MHAAPNGGIVSHFNEAVSRQVLWSDQTEVDHCWTRLGEGGALQAQQIVPGLEMFGGVADLKQARDRVVSGELGADLGYAPEPGAHEAMADYLTGEGARTIAGALPESAALSEQIAAIPMNPAAQAVGNADTFGEGIAAVEALQ